MIMIFRGKQISKGEKRDVHSIAGINYPSAQQDPFVQHQIFFGQISWGLASTGGQSANNND